MKGRANKVNKLETARKAQIIKGQGEKHDGRHENTKAHKAEIKRAKR